VRHYSKLAALVLAGAWLSAGIGWSQPKAAYDPTLHLEKPVYVDDESIRFWVGVHSKVDIPEDLRESCILHVVRPDGTKIDEHVSWPNDGDASHGWMGGWGLGKQAPMIGRYVLSFEFAGKRTADQSFDIIPNPFKTSIEASWVFIDRKPVGRVHARSILLHLENKTGRVLRFAEPGSSGSDIWLHVAEFESSESKLPSLRNSAFLTGGRTSSSTPYQTLDWDSQTTWPMVTVAAGGSAERAVSLDYNYSFRNGQMYELNVDTFLLVFVGERDDPDAQLFPLRIPVTASKARFPW